MREKLLVSACLLGTNCKYSGGNNRNEEVLGLRGSYDLIPVCPEQLGGLPTPREPAEISVDKVITASGADVTANYEKGAAEALAIARTLGCRKAVLKERSPSCGCGQLYDGTFRSVLREGDGVTAALLKKNGIAVTGESGVHTLLEKNIP